MRRAQPGRRASVPRARAPRGAPASSAPAPDRACSRPSRAGPRPARCSRGRSCGRLARSPPRRAAGPAARPRRGVALIGVGPTLVRPMPDAAARAAGGQRELDRRRPPWRSRRPCAPASDRRRRYRAAGAGMRISVRISSGASAVAKGPVKNDGDRDAPRALRPDRHDLGAERQHRRRMVVGRVAVGEVAADRGQVPHQRIGDHRGRRRRGAGSRRAHELGGLELGLAGRARRSAGCRRASRCTPGR